MNYLICVTSGGRYGEVCGYVTSEEVAKELVDAMNTLCKNDETERYYYQEDKENNSEFWKLPDIEYRLELAKKRIEETT